VTTLAREFTKGLWDEIPLFRIVLGLCPALAVTTTMENGLGMGLAATFVLVCSNGLISSLRNFIPSEVRVACYIVIIAAFVVCVEMLTKAYFFALSESLGIFIPLIVVNCIILGRAEAFASKNGIGRSFLDGLGIGIGFTLALSVLGAIRELFGTGKLTVFAQANLDVTIFPLGEGNEYLFKFMIDPPGAFVCLGAILMVMNIISARSAKAI
jgi:electron transport complex protein RnfE